MPASLLRSPTGGLSARASASAKPHGDSQCGSVYLLYRASEKEEQRARKRLQIPRHFVNARKLLMSMTFGATAALGMTPHLVRRWRARPGVRADTVATDSHGNSESCLQGLKPLSLWHVMSPLKPQPTRLSICDLGQANWLCSWTRANTARA